MPKPKNDPQQGIVIYELVSSSSSHVASCRVIHHSPQRVIIANDLWLGRKVMWSESIFYSDPFWVMASDVVSPVVPT